MPDTAGGSLRIYCVCGQKMKVSDSMYGLPGKCISCRTKIRIPREDEIPEGENEIHLEDHPHLIRKLVKKVESKKAPSDAQKALDSVPKKPRSDEDPTPVTELDIADSADVRHEHIADSLPLDPMESLQRLTCLELGIGRRLAALDKMDPGDKTARAELKGHLERVRKARRGLDEHMRQLLMEAAIELTITQDKISREQISARVGEIALAEFQDSIYRLRHRRDRLERRQLNLRGWLAATSPFNVGGFLDVGVEDIPEDGYNLPIPSEVEESSTLLKAHAASLQQAFDVRKSTETKMAEIKRLGEASEGEEKARLIDTYDTTKGFRRIAKAQVQFFQQRLDQLIRDYENDLETVEAQLEAARDRLGMDEMSRVEFDGIETLSINIRKDIVKGIDLAKRLVHANSLDDVTEPQGTFLQRLGFGNSAAARLTLYVPLWGSAIFWVLGIFLPSVGNTSLLTAFSDFSGAGISVGGILALPLLAAIAAVGISFLRNSAARGFTLIALCAVATLLIARLVNEANFSLDPLANRFRSGTTWYLRPGMISMFAADFLILMAAVAALSYRKDALRWGIGFLVLTGAVAWWTGTNGFGGSMPKPVIENLEEVFSQETGKQSGILRISNEGSRTLHLVSRRTSALNGYLYTIDRKIGGTSFSEITPDGDEIGADTSYPVISVSPESFTEIRYELPVGDYRLVLISHSTDQEIEKTFSVTRSQGVTEAAVILDEGEGEAVGELPDVSVPQDSEIDPIPAEESGFATESDVVTLPAAELTGMITGADGVHHFSIELYTEDDKKGNVLKVSLDDDLAAGWMVSEYNRGQKTVTLERNKEFVVLRRGKRVLLK